MYVVGTAGHVDHGKSRLVKALTGIDPDRLPEEKARGMTTDLGFAWLRLPGGQEISIVDVPGHERFIKNMLAGVGCIDAVLLVVAANDGVMPQTREHLAILDLLQVQKGVVAVTKTDLVDRDLLDLALEEVEELLADTCLAEAPLVPISTVTGEGLADLVAVLEQVLSETTPRPDLERPRLWIDRAFSVAGFGTVVTGTLIDGALQVGQEVEILPSGAKSRIRALETHKRRIDTAQPGARVAVNLANLAVADLERGDLLTIPRRMRPTKRLDARLRCLPGSPEPLSDGVPGRLFIGSADVEVKVRLLAAEALAPSESGLAQLFLAAPIAAVRGDRFVLRRPAIGATVGGGVVLDPHPLRHPRFQPPIISSLEAMERGDPREILRQVLGIKPPIEAPWLLQWTGLAPIQLETAIQALSEAGEAIPFGVETGEPLLSTGVYVVSRAGWQRLLSEMTHVLADYHCRFSLRQTMPREEFRSRLNMEPRLFRCAVAQATAEGLIVEESAGVRLSTHRVQLTPEQEANARRLLQAHRSSPYAPPTGMQAARDYGVDAELLRALVERGDLVSIGDDVLFMPSAYEEMTSRIVAWIKQNGSITVGQARDMLSTTRRYVMALLDYLDAQQITRRVGDDRVLRQRRNGGPDLPLMNGTMPAT
ncbi:MAG: selenocysteine-specific translation elongation factor, partial [Anaerolineae bacterium]|nr:selenocysteine-specific translation elongation factor [Anaerolineae bacterium]